MPKFVDLIFYFLNESNQSTSYNNIGDSGQVGQSNRYPTIISIVFITPLFLCT